MNRLLVALLSLIDAALAAAIGLAIALAPLTALWAFGLGGSADWGTLWPASATIWQLGHLVPVAVTLPDAYLAATGIDPSAGSFVLSLAPTVFALFTAVFAARSGARASRADAWGTGVASSTVVFAALAALVAVTGGNAVAATELWQAILFPTLFFAIPALVGAIVVEWREAGAGAVARLRDRVEAAAGGWGELPALAARGTAIVVAGFVGVGALAVAVAVVAGGAQVVSLFEAGHMDVAGVTVTALGQLAFLPTLIVWAAAFLAGPGFALGTSTSVSPVGTQLGVIPGIPVLGAVPQLDSPWFLLTALLPVALGALAGWAVRSRLVAHDEASPAPAAVAPWATPSLEGLIGAPPEARAAASDEPDDRFGVRFALTALIAVLSGAAAGLLARLTSGSLGPGRLAEVGAAPGPVALAVGLEVFVGAAILLLSPRRRSRDSTSHGGRSTSHDDRAASDGGRTWWRRDRGEDERTDAAPTTVDADDRAAAATRASVWDGRVGGDTASTRFGDIDSTDFRDSASVGFDPAAGRAEGSGRSFAVGDAAVEDATAEDAAAGDPATTPARAREDTAPLPPFVPRERGEGEPAPRRPSPLPPVD
ncbi:DUF6350 family protein [Microbacterium sp. 1P10UB]|uniref:cell division protein PerM n=1 Tax=unclassified Microbacterium TaxID=2609290 RepID=UPI00399F28C5